MGEKEERRRRRWEGGRERGEEREDENTKERESDLTGKTVRFIPDSCCVLSFRQNA